MDKPYYPHKPIGSIQILANALGMSESKLISISNDSHKSYTEFTVSDGSRTVAEPKYELKKLQKRINRRIFEQVIYPPYLQGGTRIQLRSATHSNIKQP